MPIPPEKRTEVEEKLRRTAERRLAHETIQLESGEEINAVDAVQYVVDEVEALRAELLDLAPGPSILLTSEMFDALFTHVKVTEVVSDEDGKTFRLDDIFVVRHDESSGTWLLTLVP